MTDNEIFEAVKQRFTDPKVMDLLRAGLADKNEMEDVKRAIRYGQDSMKIPSLRDKLYKIFDRLLNVVKDDSTTRQMVKQDLRQLQKKQGDSAMSEDLNTANVEKAVMHDCVTHVVDEEWGVGQCIPTMHDLSEDGIVTKYDIMFAHGIEKNVFIDEKKTKSTGHRKHKHSMMEAEEMAPVTPEGGEADAGKASKKDMKMPLEKLKGIMEKRKSDAYERMLKSQGKMEEETEHMDIIGESHVIETDSGTARVTDTHVSFNNSGFRHRFSHPEIKQLIRGKTVRGFTRDPHSPKFEHRFVNDDEAVEHHLPINHMHASKIDRNNYRVRKIAEEVELDEATAKDLDTLSKDKDPGVRLAVALNPNATAKHLDKLSKDKDPGVRLAVAQHPNATSEHLDKLSSDKHPEVRQTVAEHPKATAKHLDKLYRDKSSNVRYHVAKHPNATAKHLAALSKDEESDVRSAARRKKTMKEEAKTHTVPKTDKEKSLAKLAPPHDKITHADVMVGRGVSKKKTMKEFVEKLAESLSPKLSESLIKESDDNHEEVGMHNGDVFKPPLHGGYKSTQDNPKAHENVEKAHHEMIDHIARHLPHMDPKDRKETVRDVGSVSKKFHSAMEVDPHSQTDSEAERIEDHHAAMRKETRHAQKSSGLHSSQTLHGQHGSNPDFKKHHEALKRALENGDHEGAEKTIAAMKGK